MSEKDKKATGWNAFYVNGKWHAELKKAKPKAKAKAKPRAKPKNKA
jgi:DNA topoisomerase-1